MTHTIAETLDVMHEISSDDIEKLALVVCSWHKHSIAKLDHLTKIPEGSEMEVDACETIVLSGDTLKAFIAGIYASKSIFNELPFVVEYAPPLTQVSAETT